jgi:hypothetical protein
MSFCEWKCFFYGIWSHPPGLNRRPADYETFWVSQIVENGGHRTPFAAPNDSVPADVEQVSEQVGTPTPPSTRIAAVVEQDRSPVPPWRGVPVPEGCWQFDCDFGDRLGSRSSLSAKLSWLNRGDS